MERPSHSVFHSEHAFANRLISTALALSVPFAMALVLLHSLVGTTIRNVGPLKYVPDNTKTEHVLPPPPAPPMQPPTIIDMPPPRFLINNPSTDDHAPVTSPARGTDVTPQPPAAGPDRAVAGIMATHTTPPYPMIAVRLGEQGSVMLRLTVTADGHVTRADIVTSSGSRNLDDAAQQWIVAHWRYQPALDKGKPVASQTNATIIFNLKDAR